MRISVALALLMLAACSVENDRQNDQVRFEFDDAPIENTANRIGEAADRAASEIGKEARRAGEAIENEVGDIEVDVDIGRNRADEEK